MVIRRPKLILGDIKWKVDNISIRMTWPAMKRGLVHDSYNLYMIFVFCNDHISKLLHPSVLDKTTCVGTTITHWQKGSIFIFSGYQFIYLLRQVSMISKTMSHFVFLSFNWMNKATAKDEVEPGHNTRGWRSSRYLSNTQCDTTAYGILPTIVSD